MRVLVACEFSGVVREAFLARGHDAYSCDLLPSASPWHFQQDVTPLLQEPGWYLIIAHPPCTYIANLGVRWFKDYPVQRRLQLIDGCNFFLECLNARAPKICVENPIPHKHAMARIKVPYTQIIQPWQYGHGDTKATCLWLKGLPLLQPTEVVTGRNPRSHMMRHRHQGMLRAITPKGIAKAMATQWG